MAGTENNDTPSLANTVVSGGELKGQLSSETDIDYYKIDLAAAGQISVLFDKASSTFNNYYAVSIVDSTGTLLARRETGADTSFSTGVTSAGSYYVSVDAFTDSFGTTYYDSSEYGLTVQSQEGVTSGVETEGNNTLGEADEVISGQEIKGQLSGETDVDYYKLTAISAGQISVSFTSTTGNAEYPVSGTHFRFCQNKAPCPTAS